MKVAFTLVILLIKNWFQLSRYLLMSKKLLDFANLLPILIFNEKALVVSYFNTFLRKQLHGKLPKFGVMPAWMPMASTNVLV